ncbi:MULTISPECIES: hypothetical protein, partial [unclassified Bacillus (in: firmicutes)]|uniref:hypothetical protein n=1 Tax=unclassified Bacillus (in: firmicutes) TaxID=185979 RepID=UPI001C87E977
ITDKLSAIGCLKGVLTPVSKTGGSPIRRASFINSISLSFLVRKCVWLQTILELNRTETFSRIY